MPKFSNKVLEELEEMTVAAEMNATLKDMQQLEDQMRGPKRSL